MSKKRVAKKTTPAPIVAEGKKVPKQWEGMERKPNGHLKRKAIGMSAKGTSTLIKQRLGKIAWKVLKEELSPDRFRSIIRQIILVVEEYPDHKDFGRMAELLVRLATDPDKANTDGPQNINITINAVRENAVAGRALMGMKPINVKVVKSTVTDVGGRDSGADQQLPARLPSPAAAGPQ